VAFFIDRRLSGHVDLKLKVFLIEKVTFKQLVALLPVFPTVVQLQMFFEAAVSQYN